MCFFDTEGAVVKDTVGPVLRARLGDAAAQLWAFKTDDKTQKASLTGQSLAVLTSLALITLPDQRLIALRR